jgi:hypothetical protein
MSQGSRALVQCVLLACGYAALTVASIVILVIAAGDDPNARMLNVMIRSPWVWYAVGTVALGAATTLGVAIGASRGGSWIVFAQIAASILVALDAVAIAFQLFRGGRGLPANAILAGIHAALAFAMMKIPAKHS